MTARSHCLATFGERAAMNPSTPPRMTPSALLMSTVKASPSPKIVRSRITETTLRWGGSGGVCRPFAWSELLVVLGIGVLPFHGLEPVDRLVRREAQGGGP